MSNLLHPYNMFLRLFASWLLYATCITVSGQSVRTVFENVTTESGIKFEYTFGDNTYENIMESSGAGISIIDYNQDGLYDIYLLNGIYLEGISNPEGRHNATAYNHLYRNNGDGTFTDVSRKAGVNNMQWSMAAGVYDFDADGDQDIYLANYGPNVFYRNNGDGTFTDITDELGLRGPDKLNGFTKWSVSVAFIDYNMDEKVDILLGNFLAFDPDHRSSPDPTIMPHPGEYLGQASILYQQQEDGTFIDVTSRAGLYYPDSKCMGITVLDYDSDGDLDIFQSNDHQPNFLFSNEKNGFKEVGVPSGVAVNSSGNPTGSMHGTIGDINNDGLVDILVTDLKYGSLYQGIGGGVFKDVTELSGAATHFKGKGGWGAMLSDFDNDGDLDIFSANGTAEELILQPPLLLENTGSGKYVNNGKSWGRYFNEKHSGRGAAVLDYDNDGDLDIIVSHVQPGTNASLLENRTENNNHWLGINVMPSTGGAPITGTKVTLFANGIKLHRVYQPSTGYLSYSDPRVHFGIGALTSIDYLMVEWPNGDEEIIKNINSDQYISIQKGKGVVSQESP